FTRSITNYYSLWVCVCVCVSVCVCRFPRLEYYGVLSANDQLCDDTIEDGGKAAHCKKLKVGDELININGSPLYGSRQEALILIKGSYRILKLTVR
uniref:PDZ domain-containing protein n=1 Tax=Astatotilapia calliptera TaxID=8154 RepID=A0AAX7TYA5_ASTCA